MLGKKRARDFPSVTSPSGPGDLSSFIVSRPALKKNIDSIRKFEYDESPEWKFVSFFEHERRVITTQGIRFSSKLKYRATRVPFPYETEGWNGWIRRPRRIRPPEDHLKVFGYEFRTLKTRIRDLIEIVCRAGMKESLRDDNLDDVKWIVPTERRTNKRCLSPTSETCERAAPDNIVARQTFVNHGWSGRHPIVDTWDFDSI